MKRLSSLTKWVYGFGDLGNSIGYTIIGFFYLYYLTDVAGISPGVAGVILLIGRIWDAVIDPFIGHISDRMRTPMGRRRPFFLIFSLPFALFFYLIWNVPELTYPLKVLYVFLTFLLFITFFSLIQIPYTSLTAQLTKDYDERTLLTGYRMAFSIAGGLICAVVPIEIVHAFKDQRTGFGVMGLIFGLTIFLSPVALFLFIREERNTDVQDFNFLKDVKDVLKNRPFINAILMFLFTWIGIDILSAMLIYYIKYYLKMEDKTSILLGLIFIVATLFLPLWFRITKRIGKKRAYNLGMFIMITTLSLLFILPGNDRTFIYILAFIGGIGVSAAHIVPWSILPDVVEYDEMKTGRRREGIYSGISSFLHQLSSSGAMFIIGFLLQIGGYRPNVEQSETSILTIKILLSVIPSFLFLMGILSLYFYPITREKHKKIKSIIRKKRERDEVLCRGSEG